MKNIFNAVILAGAVALVAHTARAEENDADRCVLQALSDLGAQISQIGGVEKVTLRNIDGIRAACEQSTGQKLQDTAMLKSFTFTFGKH